MQQAEHKSFGKPDEVRKFPNGHAEIVSIGDGEVGRMVFEPGWRWSNDVKPVAQTESCEAPHFQYHVSGQLAIRMDDGTAEPSSSRAQETSLHFRVGAMPGCSETSRSLLWTGSARATL